MGKLFAFACATTGIYFAVALFALMHPVAWTSSMGQSQGVAAQRTVRALLKSNDLERTRSERKSAFAPGSGAAHVCAGGRWSAAADRDCAGRNLRPLSCISC